MSLRFDVEQLDKKGFPATLTGTSALESLAKLPQREEQQGSRPHGARMETCLPGSGRDRWAL